MKLKILISSYLSICLSFSVLAIDKAVYGTFDIKDISKASNIAVKINANSSALMVAKHSLRMEIKDSLYSLKSTKLSSRLPVCQSSFEADELSLGACSAFLVAPNKVLTAGHCVLDAAWDCAQKLFIFDAKKELLTNSKAQYFVQSQVYSCKNILKHVNDTETGIDFALIELDRDVTGRKPLYLSDLETSVSDQVYMIGHPLGTSTKFSDNAYIRSSTSNFYVSTLDSFIGNSGSAVFSSDDHSLIGLLARGEDDYRWNSEAKCFDQVVCGEEECRGEEIIKSTVIKEAISDLL